MNTLIKLSNIIIIIIIVSILICWFVLNCYIGKSTTSLHFVNKLLLKKKIFQNKIVGSGIFIENCQ